MKEAKREILGVVAPAVEEDHCMRMWCGGRNGYEGETHDERFKDRRGGYCNGDGMNGATMYVCVKPEHLLSATEAVKERILRKEEKNDRVYSN